MQLRLFIWASLLLADTAGCESPESSASSSSRQELLLPQEVTSPALTVLPYDSTEYGDLLKGEATQLSAQDLNQIEWLLQACIEEYNQAEVKRLQHLAPQHPVDKTSLISLSNYNRQVVPILNARGEKVVWVNCFCQAPHNWRTQRVQARDGGSCYFSVTLNLSKRKWYDLGFNGDA